MNQQSGPQIGPHAGSADESQARNGVQSVARAIAASHLTVLIGAPSPDTSSTAREAASAHAATATGYVGARHGVIVVVFDDWSGDPLLSLIDSIAIAVDHATGTLVTRPSPDPRSLDDVLSHWSKRFDRSFVIVLDRFDQNLVAEPLRARNARFTEHLAQAVAAASDNARFLVVVDPRNESLLHRLSARLPRPCTNVVRIKPLAGGDTRPDTPPARDSAGRKRSAEAALPNGFSAIGDGNIDSAATEAVLRRREQRRRSMRWAIGGGIALALAIAAGVSLLLVRSHSVDPGRLLTQRVEPAPRPAPIPALATPAPSDPATSPAPNVAAIPSRSGVGTEDRSAPSVDAFTSRDMSGHSPAMSKQPVATAIITDATDRPAPAVEGHTEKPLAVAPDLPKPEQPRETADANRGSPTVEGPPAEGRSGQPAGAQGSKAEAHPAEKHEHKPAAFRIDAPPAPPIAEHVIRKVPNPERGPMVFLHIRSESQRAKAREIERRLPRMGIVVSGIRLDESGPLRTDLRYFRSAERDEANYLGTALGRMGAAPARVSFVPGHEANAARRHYELWFAPPRG